ncbi:hypothetical protein LguiB_022499 [Lonicera macranthoides]
MCIYIERGRKLTCVPCDLRERAPERRGREAARGRRTGSKRAPERRRTEAASGHGTATGSESAGDERKGGDGLSSVECDL